MNDRQYVAKMPNVRARAEPGRAPAPDAAPPPQVDNLEVWFQRASDVVRKMRQGDLDLGIVGYDMFVELGEVRRRAAAGSRQPRCAPPGSPSPSTCAGRR